MNNQERIDAAGKRKDEGNVLFKVGKYERAAKKYNKALDYLSEEDESFEDEELKVVKPIRVSCWLNAAACCLKLEDFHEAIKFRSQVHANQVRFGFHLNRVWVVAFLGHLREVKPLQKSLGKLKAESNKRDATLYSNMFSHMAKVSSPAEAEGG